VREGPGSAISWCGVGIPVFTAKGNEGTCQETNPNTMKKTIPFPFSNYFAFQVSSRARRGTIRQKRPAGGATGRGEKGKVYQNTLNLHPSLRLYSVIHPSDWMRPAEKSSFRKEEDFPGEELAGKEETRQMTVGSARTIKGLITPFGHYS